MQVILFSLPSPDFKAEGDEDDSAALEWAENFDVYAGATEIFARSIR